MSKRFRYFTFVRLQDSLISKVAEKHKSISELASNSLSFVLYVFAYVMGEVNEKVKYTQYNLHNLPN